MTSTLAVIGLGAVSPLGDAPVAHAARVRARLRPAIASAFAVDGEPIDAIHVPWLDARLAVAQRAVTMAQLAMRTASAEVEGTPSLFLVLPRPRPGFDRDVAASVAADLGRPAARFEGDAGAFAALAAADRWLGDGRATAVMVVALDSFIACEALEAARARPPSPWAQPSLPLAEGAFALCVTTPGGGRKPIATIEGAAVAVGGGNDDDDEPADGVALTDLLRALPPRGPIRRVWGQEDVDGLRGRELRHALARTASLFAPELACDSLERFAGRLGAAAGLANLVQGLATIALEGGAAPAPSAPFAAWAISPDGTRGAALVHRGAS